MTDGWTDGRTDGHRDGDDVDFEISCSRRSFRPTGRPTARARPLARSLIQKKLLCQVTQESPSASPLPSTPPAELLPRSSGAGSHHARRPDLRASSGFRNFPLAYPARCELPCRYSMSVYTKRPTSGKLCFVVYAIYAMCDVRG